VAMLARSLVRLKNAGLRDDALDVRPRSR